MARNRGRKQGAEAAIMPMLSSLAVQIVILTLSQRKSLYCL